MAFLGEIRMYGGKKPPEGWRFCDGSLLEIPGHEDLFALIQTTFGGDGMDTFGLPDLRGRVPVHRDPTIAVGQTGGAERVTLVEANTPRHTHDFNATTALADQPSPGANTTAQSGTISLYTQADASSSTALNAMALTPLSGGGGPLDNMPPFLVVNYIIAIEGMRPAAEEADGD